MNYLTTLILIILFNVVGSLIGYTFDISSLDWYKNISSKIATIPPGYVFGIVWTTLYTMLAISFSIVLQSNHPLKNIGIIFFVIQMVFNYMFTPLFVSEKLALSTFTILLTIMFTILSMLVFYKIDLTATLLLVPYLCWLLQAWYFNNRLASLNL